MKCHIFIAPGTDIVEFPNFRVENDYCPYSFNRKMTTNLFAKTSTGYIVLVVLLIMTSVGATQAQNTIGVTDYTPGAMIDGYTLFTPMTGKNTILMDACGREVNQWQSGNVAGASVYLLENGNLLRTEEDTAAIIQTHGGGGGYVKMYDWDSNEEWSYRYSDSLVRAHHDIEYLPNGNVLILAWELKTIDEAIAAGRNPNFFSENVQTLWPEHLVEVNPQNDSIVWEWHLWDHLVQDFDPDRDNYGAIGDFPERIDLNAVSNTPDFVHINSVDYNAELDQIIVSAHAYSEIWVIDHSTTTAEAASHSGGNSGKGGDILYRWGNPAMYAAGDTTDRMLFKQHDAQWITEGEDTGKIMVFNNGSGRTCPPPCNGYSSIDIIDPPIDSLGNYNSTELPFLPATYDWHYVKPDSLAFYSSFISGVQRLANEHTLVCSGAQKTFFEIDENDEVIWEYVNPMHGDNPLTQGDSPASASTVFRAYRYADDFPGLDGQDLTPGEFLELDPDPALCSMITSVEDAQAQNTDLKVFPNPVRGNVTVAVGSERIERLALYNSFGQQLDVGAQVKLKTSEMNLDMSGLPAGIYLLQVETTAGKFVERVVKQ